MDTKVFCVPRDGCWRQIPKGKDLADIAKLLPALTTDNVIHVRDFALIHLDHAEFFFGHERLKFPEISLERWLDDGFISRILIRLAHLAPVFYKSVLLHLDHFRPSFVEKPKALCL